MNVYKQVLEVRPLQKIEIPITKGSQDIVKVGLSQGKPCLWFLAQSCSKKVLVIHSYMTGEDIPDDIELEYLGNYKLDVNILVHVFGENQ